uniref:Uncharacterized protein n=1 Tax=Vitis vinifera TaxID=29760 RepID=F6HFS6_VITVI
MPILGSSSSHALASCPNTAASLQDPGKAAGNNNGAAATAGN